MLSIMNRPLKNVVYTGMVIGFFFCNSTAFGTDGYAWAARFLGFAFVILQQVILLDLAYTWLVYML